MREQEEKLGGRQPVGCKEVYQGGEGQFEDKKSRFLSSVCPVRTEEDALHHLEKIRKQHYDARHHCFAYVLGEKQEIQRCSDDGEPSGTAGRPILDILLGEDIHNAIVVVTRYFGGTLLGTGGLVRAYSAAAKEGLNASQIIEKTEGKKLSVCTDYNGIGKIQYIAGSLSAVVLNTEYTDKVEMIAALPLTQVDDFVKTITEATAGKALITGLSEIQLAMYEGKMLIFEE